MQQSQYRFSMMAAAMSALFSPALYAAGAGKVDFATAGVNAINGQGQARPLSRGSEINPGETIDTGAGRAQLRFTDGGMVSLQPQTQFRLENYGYDKDDAKKNSVVMNLLKGGLRTITGLIGKTNREGYKLQTATATVGIRGTEFSVTSFPDGSVLFNCADGAIDVTNQSGSTTVNGGQSTTVSSQTSTPTKTEEKPFLPPAVTVQQTQLPAPLNPVQDATNVASALLVGTFAGQWRTASFSLMQLDSTPTSYEGNPNYTPTFTVSPSGHLTSYGYSSTYTDFYGNPYTRTVTLGSGTAQSYGNDGVMAWGRWVGTVNDTTFGTTTYTSDNPLHYVAGLPVTNLPTSGSATYSMYGSTGASCSGSGCGGAITVSSSLTVNFGSYSGSYNLNVANSADGVSLQNTSSLSFDSTGVNFNGNSSLGYGTTSVGTTSVYSANSAITGFLAGPAASHAGAVWNVNYGYEGGNTALTGAIVYKR